MKVFGGYTIKQIEAQIKKEDEEKTASERFPL